MYLLKGLKGLAGKTALYRYNTLSLLAYRALLALVMPSKFGKVRLFQRHHATPAPAPHHLILP